MGTVFKILDARQSEIHIQFTRNISLNLCKNIRKLFRKLKRFSWPIFDLMFAVLLAIAGSWSPYRKLKGSLLPSRQINFTLFVTQRNISGGYLLRLQTLYNFTYKSSRLSRCRERFSWKYSENFHWISDCRASSILKAVPVSEDSKENALCKHEKFMH